MTSKLPILLCSTIHIDGHSKYKADSTLITSWMENPQNWTTSDQETACYLCASTTGPYLLYQSLLKASIWNLLLYEPLWRRHTNPKGTSHDINLSIISRFLTWQEISETAHESRRHTPRYYFKRLSKIYRPTSCSETSKQNKICSAINFSFFRACVSLHLYSTKKKFSRTSVYEPWDNRNAMKPCRC